MASDPYDQFVSKALHYTLLLIIAMLLVIIPFQPTIERVQFGILTEVLLLACFILLHTQRPKAAALGFLIGSWIVLTSAAIMLDGVRNTGISAYTIIIIFSALLFPGRVVILMTLISITTTGLLLIGENAGILPPASTGTLLSDRFSMNIVLFTTSGALLWLSARAFVRMLGVLQDREKEVKERNKQLEAEIAERVQIETDLRQSEENYRILFEHSTLMAAVYDSEDRIRLINPAVGMWMKVDPDSLLGKNVYDVMSPELAKNADERHQRVRETGISETVEGQSTDPEGAPFHYMRQVVSLPNDEILTLTLDVTPQKTSEAQELALKLAAEKADFLTEFFGTISHDLKTPLTVLNTTLYLLEKSRTEEQRAQNLERMRENIEVVQDYIQDMLSYSRLEYLPSFERKPVMVHRLLEEVIKRLRPRADSKGIMITTYFDPQLPEVFASYDHLLRAFLNLVENSVAYTPSSGKVELKTARAGDQIEIIISDTGVGIAPDDVPNIFERFYRGGAAEELDKGGSGLGLSIVKKVIDMHEGTIQVRSVVGKGTSFIVTLPRSPKDE